MINLMCYRNTLTTTLIASKECKKHIIRVLIKHLEQYDDMNIYQKEEGIIIFDRIIVFTTHTGKNKLQAFKLLRKGEIKLLETNKGLICIEYSTSLKFIQGITVCIFFVFLILEGSILTSFSVSITFYLVYFFANKIKIDALVNKVLDEVE